MLEKIQPPPTMDAIILAIINGLVHGAINELMTSMLEDQVESRLVHRKNCSNLNTR
jgi:hypothetical protein